MPATHSRDLEVATHEAGHAVARVLLGVTGSAELHMVTPGQHEGCEAGGLCGAMPTTVEGWTSLRTDRQIIAGLVVAYALCHGARAALRWRDELRRETDDFVGAVWCLIRVVAIELLRRRHLTDAEVRRVIAACLESARAAVEALEAAG